MGLHLYYDYKNYPNVLNKNIEKKLNWKIPKGLERNKIFIFDSLSVHRSNKINKVPRIALNVKIQPRSLDYLFNLNKTKKNFKKGEVLNNLEKLEKKLLLFAKKNNALNFELSVLNYLKGNFKNCFKFLKKFCLFNLDEKKFNEIIFGSIKRKTLEQIDGRKKNKLLKKNTKIEKLSCAHSIIKTIRI